MVFKKNLLQLGYSSIRKCPPKWIISNALAATTDNILCKYIDDISHDQQERGIDLARQKQPDEVLCLFHSLKQLGISTSNRVHTLSSSCDTVTRFIKMGFLNKNMVLQYSHYINELARIAEECDSEYYQNKSHELLIYLLRNDRDLTVSSITQLVADVADVSPKTCTMICDKILDEFKLTEKFNSRFYSKLLKACYKFELWDQANSLMSKNTPACDFNLCLIDPMIEALKKSISTLEESKSVSSNEEIRRKKETILEHLFKFIEGSSNFRTQFITKYANQVGELLIGLNLHVVKNPTIKLSGRCTSCGTRLPLFNVDLLNELNSAIKDVLLCRISNKQNKFYLNSSSKDLENFEVFLKNLTKDENPIDCVIDGLNIAYRNTDGLYYVQQAITEDFSRSVKRQKTEALGRIVINTILRSQLLKNFRKILVIGREHMRSWPGLLEFFEKQKIHYYLSPGKSNDDLFSLYASTLHPKTILVSSDFFRDHLAQLDADKRILLERWLDTRQSWVYYKSLTTLMPTPYEKIPSLDRKSGHFHIPVIDYYKLESIAKHEPPPHLNKKMTTWLCCKIDLQ